MTKLHLVTAEVGERGMASYKQERDVLQAVLHVQVTMAPIPQRFMYVFNFMHCKKSRCGTTPNAIKHVCRLLQAGGPNFQFSSLSWLGVFLSSPWLGKAAAGPKIVLWMVAGFFFF